MKQKIIDEMNRRAKPLHTNQDLDVLLDAIGDTPIVLLGEATHGTSEFYTWRAEITKRLIVEKGFTTVVVEGDWPACYEINRYIKGRSHQQADTASLLAQTFHYFPSWVLGNEEMVLLIDWLKEYNQGQSEENKVSFYGNDVKSLWECLEEVIAYLERTGSQELLELARNVYTCLESSQRNPQLYGLNAVFFNLSCEDGIAELYRKIEEKRELGEHRNEDDLNDEINALTMLHSEQYFRAMAMEGPDNWNLRCYHMVDVINRIRDHYGENSKIIVWGHNTHLGDARATEGMPLEGLVNEGQILREQMGEDAVYAIGFSTYSGSVIATTAWGEPLEEMVVPAAYSGGWDALLHEASAEDKLFIFEREEPIFSTALPQRAIGVVYQPEKVEYQTYVVSRLSQRYNALIYIDHTKVVKPL